MYAVLQICFSLLQFTRFILFERGQLREKTQKHFPKNYQNLKYNVSKTVFYISYENYFRQNTQKRLNKSIMKSVLDYFRGLGLVFEVSLITGGICYALLLSLILSVTPLYVQVNFRPVTFHISYLLSKRIKMLRRQKSCCLRAYICRCREFNARSKRSTERETTLRGLCKGVTMICIQLPPFCSTTSLLYLGKQFSSTVSSQQTDDASLLCCIYCYYRRAQLGHQG